MSVTIYQKNNGKPVTFAHMIDAKESVANGFYTFEKPVKTASEAAEPELVSVPEPSKVVVPEPEIKVSEPVKEPKPEPIKADIKKTTRKPLVERSNMRK